MKDCLLYDNCMTGPPKTPQSRMNADIRIRVTANQHNFISKAASENPQGLSAWARDVLVREAKFVMLKRMRLARHALCTRTTWRVIPINPSPHPMEGLRPKHPPREAVSGSHGAGRLGQVCREVSRPMANRRETARVAHAGGRSTEGEHLSCRVPSRLATANRHPTILHVCRHVRSFQSNQRWVPPAFCSMIAK